MIPKILHLVVFGAAALNLYAADESAIDFKSTTAKKDFGAVLKTMKPERTIGLEIDKLHEHTYEDLEHFYLSIDVENASVSDALDRLNKSYQKSCELSGEKALPLLFKVDGKPERIISLKAEGAFQSLLERILILSDCEMQRTEYLLSVSPLTLSVEQKMIEIKQPVAPDVRNVLGLEADTTNTKLKNALHLSTEAELKHDEARSQFVIKGPSHEVNRARKLLKNLHDVKPVQYSAAFKLVSFPTDSEVATLVEKKSLGQLSDGETQMIMRSLIPQNGAKIATAPSILCRFNEYARIEIIRELNISPTEKDWTGFMLDLQITELHGFSMQTTIGFDEGVLFDNDKVVHYRTKVESLIRDQKTVVFKIHEENGRGYYAFASLNKIDATGKRIRE